MAMINGLVVPLMFIAVICGIIYMGVIANFYGVVDLCDRHGNLSPGSLPEAIVRVILMVVAVVAVLALLWALMAYLVNRP